MYGLIVSVRRSVTSRHVCYMCVTTVCSCQAGLCSMTQCSTEVQKVNIESPSSTSFAVSRRFAGFECHLALSAARPESALRPAQQLAYPAHSTDMTGNSASDQSAFACQQQLPSDADGIAAAHGGNAAELTYRTVSQGQLGGLGSDTPQGAQTAPL